jgi:ribonuclease D
VIDFVVRPEEIARVARECAAAPYVAVDVEASGMHAYRARVCTVQLAWNDGERIAIVDALATSVEPLAAVLGARTPVKLVHDVAFDARLLAEAGIVLGGVHDTAIAARMLARPATGLATLLSSELEVVISKALQHHDWRLRPLDAAMLDYLALDVRHLEALAAKLWLEVRARGIEPEVLEETQYRIASAAASAALPPPPPEAAYLRLKGSDRLGDRQLATLRAVAAVREREAERRDVPVHQVASAEALVALVRARPTTVAEVARVRGFGLATPEALAFAGGLVRAIAAAGDTLPPDERAHFHPVHPPAALVRVRRERENRLIAWRRSEAKLRTVDEQVVLPGHCLKHAAYTDVDTIDGLSHVPGIGGFRVERDGPAILRVLAGEWTAPPSAVAPADGNGA